MSTDTTKPANGVEKGTLAVAIATLACSAIGGIVAYVTIDRRTAQLDGRIKQIEIQQAEEQLMELTGGLYDVSTLGSSGIFSRYDGPYQMYEPVEIAIVAKNAGTAPLKIRDFELHVFRAPMLAVSKTAIDESIAPPLPVERAPNGDLELPPPASPDAGQTTITPDRSAIRKSLLRTALDVYRRPERPLMRRCRERPGRVAPAPSPATAPPRRTPPRVGLSAPSSRCARIRAEGMATASAYRRRRPHGTDRRPSRRRQRPAAAGTGTGVRRAVVDRQIETSAGASPDRADLRGGGM